jgi:hypothetical protein
MGSDVSYEFRSSCLRLPLQMLTMTSRSLTKIIGMIDKTLKWPLLSGSILERWVSGKAVILGDAAHAMLPYMSQGTLARIDLISFYL